MFSVTSSGTCCRPLCTAIVRPTKSGVMLERRDQVLIGFLLLSMRAFSTLVARCASTYGPFLTERGTVQNPLFLASMNDHRIRALVGARLVTLGRRAPGADRMASALGAAFAAAVRGIPRVHGGAAHRWTDAAPARRASLAELAQTVFGV